MSWTQKSKDRPFKRVCSQCDTVFYCTHLKTGSLHNCAVGREGEDCCSCPAHCPSDRTLLYCWNIDKDHKDYDLITLLRKLRVDRYGSH
jgi:hypothetical protein